MLQYYCLRIQQYWWYVLFAEDSAIPLSTFLYSLSRG